MPELTKPITTNLFSFKTFRSPDKIDFNQKEEFFIHHPDITLSAFNQCPIPEGNSSTDQLDKFLNKFKPAKSYKEIRAKHPAMYDYSSLLMQQRKNDSTKGNLDEKKLEPLNNVEILKVWDELFVQLATQASKTVRQACIQLIIAQHCLKNNKTFDLKDVSKLVVVIPDVVIACFKPWRFSKCGGELFGIQNLGIQEYRRVEQTLCCYVPGEVSHIENIMAKEYKEKSTRNLLRTEFTTEITNETEIENINDTTSTERHELSSESAKELQKDKSFDISGSVSVSKDSKVFGSITANVSSGYNSSSSSSTSNTEAKNYAKEITERALERVVQKTTEKRTFKMIKEFEENNKHGFDNTLGTQHVTGVYRWVDKIYDNELVNYGRRLLFEISVPSPAEFYKKAMTWKSKAAESAVDVLTPPKTLAEFGLSDPSNLVVDEIEKITEAASYYGVTIVWPEIEKTFTKSDNYNVGYQNDDSYTPVTDVPIEATYGVYRVVGSFSFDYKGRKNKHAYLNLYFAGQNKGFNDYCSGTGKCQGGDSFDLWFNPNVFTSLPVYLRHRFIGEFAYNCTIYCKLSNEVITQWQSDVYAELQQAYNQLLAKHEEELALQQAAQQAEADQQGNENNSNPGMNRLIEERELKRLCIEMMSKPYCYDMGKSFSTCKTEKCESECGEVENVVSEVIQNEALVKYAEFIKFFETAFHWEIFSYIFYPYYYAAKCNWSALLQTKNDDPIFEAFLQSGMAKLLVPVRPQYEKAVMWYIETGEIYTDENLVPEIEDDRYLSLLKELQNQEEVRVEGKWKTRVPSALTIIQAKSTYLEDEKGLPCCDDETEVFGRDDRLLEGADPQPE